MIKRISQFITIVLLALLLSVHSASAKQAPNNFFIHNGDTVVFYGDSITEQLMYPEYVETYVATRYPTWHVKFINSGCSGDKVGGGGGGPIDVRLKRDVVPYSPTVVTILLGMNDGNYSPYSDSTFATYTAGLTHIVDSLTQALPNVRIVLLTPSLFDYNAKARTLPDAGKNNDFQHPAPDYNATLVKFGDFIRTFAATRHLPVVDMNAPMVTATATGRQSDPTFALSSDGVHPNQSGHLIMAASILTAWNGSPTVADIDVKIGKPVTRTDPLPWPYPDGAKQAFAVSPLPGQLDVFRLHADRVKADPNATYSLTVDGAQIATLTAAQLTAGVDLTQYPALPQNAQAMQVEALIHQRTVAWHSTFQGGRPFSHAADAPNPDELAKLKAVDTQLDDLRSQEFAAAQPKPHTFEVTPAAQTPQPAP
jgi:lysophospholipase L1-like esterase